jgi:cytochrome c-type biogenesis protein CcmF
LRAGPEYDPVSREGALVLNNLFLSVAAATVLLGTTLPLATQAFGATISIAEPYFNITVAPLMALLFVVLPFAQEAPWRRADVGPILKRLAPAAAAALAAGVAAFVFLAPSLWLAFGVAVGVWVVLGAVADLWRRSAGGGVGRMARLSLGVWGMAIAHIGVGVFVVGAATESAARVERTFEMTPGSEVTQRGWTFQFQGVREVEGPNYTATQADILATHDGVTETLQPEKRFYPVAGTPTTEVSIRKTLGGDVYVALGDPVRENPGAWRMRVAHHPLIDWVFAGAILIAAGGLMALGARARRPAAAPATAGAAQPAEAGT